MDIGTQPEEYGVRNQHAYRVAWTWSAVLAATALTVVAVRYGNEWGTAARFIITSSLLALTGTSAALLAIGFGIRQRVIDEPVINEILCAYEARLHGETKSSAQ